MVGVSDGVRAKMTGDWRDGWVRAISFAFWSVAFPFDVPYGGGCGFVW